MTRILIERTRTHYARSDGDPFVVRVDEPVSLDLELTASYARDLLAVMKRELATPALVSYKDAQLSIDVPVRLFLSPSQFEQLIEQLSAVLK